MSGDVSNKKRLIAITEANLKEKNSHIYISGHLDFFPERIILSPELYQPIDAMRKF